MKAVHLFLFVCLVGILSSFDVSSHEKGCDCLSMKEYSCFIGQTEDRIYIDPEAINMIDHQFYLNVDNNLMPISGLFSDADGIYISRKRESEKGWTCPICFAYNPPGRLVCINVASHWLYEPENR
jgi:hypothetical protein